MHSRPQKRQRAAPGAGESPCCTGHAKAAALCTSNLRRCGPHVKPTRAADMPLELVEQHILPLQVGAYEYMAFKGRERLGLVLNSWPLELKTLN